VSASSGRRGHLSTSPFKPRVVEPVIPDVFAVGDRVTHDKYGLGTVVAVNGTREVIVNFGAETRRIALPNPKISPL
jgi:hypothetical protein